jgi:hypothetical protein
MFLNTNPVQIAITFAFTLLPYQREIDYRNAPQVIACFSLTKGCSSQGSLSAPMNKENFSSPSILVTTLSYCVGLFFIAF